MMTMTNLSRSICRRKRKERSRRILKKSKGKNKRINKKKKRKGPRRPFRRNWRKREKNYREWMARKLSLKK